MKHELFLKYKNKKKFQNCLITLDEEFEDTLAYLANYVIIADLNQQIT